MCKGKTTQDNLSKGEKKKKQKPGMVYIKEK